MLKDICTPHGGTPEPVTIVQFVGRSAHVVFQSSDGTPSEAEMSWFSNVHEELAWRILDAVPHPPTVRFSDIPSKGYYNSLIAEVLGISKQTENAHVSDIFSKLVL